jgi:hypothetical protein
MSPIYLPSKSIWHGRRNNLLVAHNFCAFAYFISFLFSLFARSSSWRNEKKKSTHATLHFPAGSFGLHASRVPSIKHSSQYYSQSSSQSLCGMTVAIFQQPPPPWKMCRNIPPTPFSKQKRDEPGLVSSSFWMGAAGVGGGLQNL